MAHKPQSFKLIENEKEKIIVLYTNITVDAEKPLIEFYMKNGFTPKLEEKKAQKTVADMKKELKDAPEVLAEFEKAYSEKNGFFNACKVYSDWKKKK